MGAAAAEVWAKAIPKAAFDGPLILDQTESKFRLLLASVLRS